MTTALQFLQLHTVLTKPRAIGMGLSQLLLYLTVVVNLTFLRIDEQYFPWLETSFRHHIVRLEIHDAYF